MVVDTGSSGKKLVVKVDDSWYLVAKGNDYGDGSWLLEMVMVDDCR